MKMHRYTDLANFLGAASSEIKHKQCYSQTNEKILIKDFAVQWFRF
jgi:hypothetical protein